MTFKPYKCNRRVIKKIGENRVKECYHLERGYCTHEKNVVTDSSSEEYARILEKDGKLYHSVDWTDCYLCTYYTPQP